MKVLCLDIEGGHGGSSRSLYFLLKHMDRSKVAPTVWLRRSGEVTKRYQSLGIPAVVVPDLPKASALPRPSRNLVQLTAHGLEFLRARKSLAELLEAADGSDLVHFNHEGFAGLGFWLSRRTKTPITFHIRTNVAPSVFSRTQMWMISRAARSVVFISKNEERTFRSLGGTSPGQVIFNVVEPVSHSQRHPDIPADGRFVVASLSNTAYIRGTDRLIEVAASLKRQGRTDILFAVAGDTKLDGALRRKPQYANCNALEEVAAKEGLDTYFRFLGHVTDPERVLMSADVLIKPTRESNPWGRDILEAMAAGRAVLSIGTDQTFVRTGETGILLETYDADAMAGELARLATSRHRCQEMGSRAQDLVRELCNGPDRARDLASLWAAAAA